MTDRWLDKTTDTYVVAASDYDSLREAILNVVAHKASPPEYPGLALVPVSDIERLEAYLNGDKR